MAMDYKFRWYYALVMIFVVGLTGYYALIRPDTQQIASNNLYVRQLTDELNAVNGSDANSHLLPKDKLSFTIHGAAEKELSALSVLTRNAHLAGLSILSLQRLSSDGELKFHLSATGKFDQVSAFIILMDASLLNFYANVTDKGQLKLEGDILFKDISAFSPDIKLLFLNAPRNPFCPSMNSLPLLNNKLADMRVSVPLRLMTMTGSLMQGSRRVALILLPEKVMVVVSAGEILGKEQGIVMAIASDHLSVMQPDGSQVTISRHHTRIEL
jgi:hypothetical protein